ncbi:MAG TPA: MmgE/PrpD family protein [Vicinamibacterales bacterium]|nr:MmgE/PrpD family protein [Vicinamibacterales bacterium]
MPIDDVVGTGEALTVNKERHTPALRRLAGFVTSVTPPADARTRAASAVLDTIGVTLAGVTEPAARIVRTTLAPVGEYGCVVWGTDQRSTAPDAALANGTAAHALDYDDMCFVSLAHPSAPLVPAVIATAEIARASGRAALDAYVVGFEVEARLGRVMNPRHYQRGWHNTSTLGTIGAAAAASRLLGLSAEAAGHAIAIAASEASGLKENFGSMVKPLHAGLAARNGVLAAMLAKAGMTASARAVDGPQGFLHAMDSERDDLAREIADLGERWEIVETGITVKLYPSCAGTHPTLDALLDLHRREKFTTDDVERVEIDVDPIVPTILIYDRPTSPLEAKFSMPFCAAAAIVFGQVGIDTFDDDRIRDARVLALMQRVTMRVDPDVGKGAPALTEARVRVHLKRGGTLAQDAHGARGYPERPATDAELDAKFMACAGRVLPKDRAAQALGRLRDLEDLHDPLGLVDLLRA